MTTFTTVLVCLLFSGLCTAKSTHELEQASVDKEFEGLFSRGRVLEQTAVGSTVAQEAEREEIDCGEVKIYADLLLLGGRVLRTVNTANVTTCCKECQELETCTSFRRNRSSGSCDLVDAPEAGYAFNPYSDQDIGGYFASEWAYSHSVEPGAGPVPPCIINEGRAYPNGNVLARGNSGTAYHCCEICREVRDCYSWHFNNRNNRCTLNGNIPSARSSPNFNGGALI